MQPSKFTRAPMIQPPPPGEVEVLPIRGNVYAIFGAGANIVVSVGSDGVLLVDAGRAEMSDKVLAAVQRLQREWVDPQRADVDRLRRGNAVVGRRSAHHRAAETDSLHHQHQRRSRSRWRQREAAQRGAHIHRRQRHRQHRATPPKARRFSRTRTCSRGWRTPREGQTPLPADALPTDAYFVDFYKLSHYFNGEGIQLFHMPKAHTDGDSIVHFRGTDVIALGDSDVHGLVSGDRRRQGRHDQRRARWTEPRARHVDRRVPSRRRHADGAGAWTSRGFGRCRLLPRHADDHSRPRRGPDQEGPDTRAGEGREPERRLRHRVRIDDRALDHGELHRSGVQDASVAARLKPDTTGGKSPAPARRR